MITIEVAQAELRDEVTEAEFLAVAEALQEGFLHHQAGFIKRILTQGEGRRWLALVFWESAEAAYSAAQIAMQNPSVQAFASKFKEGSFSMQWVSVKKEWTA